MELTMELKELTGTERQTRWAKEIRAKFLQGVDGYMTSTLAKAKGAIAYGKADAVLVADIKTAFEKYREAVCNESNATWFIDHRDASPQLAAGDAMKSDILAARSAFDARK